jgi:hypothetical protein
MQPPPLPPDGLSREELYKNWLVWVTSNLGDDAEMLPIAANAAADAAVKGDGFNASAEAARSAWVAAAPPDRQLWRPGFWSLLLTNLYFLGLVLSLILAPVIYITILVAPILLAIVIWKAYTFWRLSKRGVVVPGSLVDVKESSRTGRGGRTYLATYQFDFHGPHTTSQEHITEGSIRQDVLVLFDPRHLWLAMVMPELLNPGA